MKPGPHDKEYRYDSQPILEFRIRRVERWITAAPSATRWRRFLQRLRLHILAVVGGWRRGGLQ